MRLETEPLGSDPSLPCECIFELTINGLVGASKVILINKNVTQAQPDLSSRSLTTGCSVLPGDCQQEAVSRGGSPHTLDFGSNP